MIFKKKMAYEIVRMIKGEAAATAAQENFENVFSKKGTPDKVAVIEASIEASMVSTILEAGMAGSNAEAKRKIEQGGVSLDGEKITDITAKITAEMSGKILKVGKHEFRKIKTD